MSSPTLRVGLVGTGFLARTRVRCWRRVHGVRVELVAVAARRPEDGVRFAREHGIARAEESAETLFAAADVDLVDLCVPNRLHRPFTEGAARAGKSVLCTKPLAAYVGQDLDADASAEAVAGHDRAEMLRVAMDDARAMQAAAQRAGVNLHYGENWIYAPSVRRAAELAAKSSGRLLEMRGWESHSGSHSEYARDWRHTGGGALLRLGAHPVGTMLWLKRVEGLRLAGKPIRLSAVTAEVADPAAGAGGGADQPSRGVESWGCSILHFEDGSRGVAYGSDTCLGGMQSRLQLFGSDYQLQCNLSPHDLLEAYAARDGTFGDAYIMEKADGQAGWTTPLPDEDQSSGQQGLCQAVAEAAAEGRDSAADGQLGVDVVEATYAAYVSAARGQRITLAPRTT